MSSITLGRGIMALTVSTIVGGMGFKGSQVLLTYCYGKAAEENKEWIEGFSKIAGVTLGLITAMAFSATRKPLTAVPLPTPRPAAQPTIKEPSTMGLYNMAVVEERYGSIMMEWSQIRDQLDGHATNGFKYLEELTTDSQQAVSEEVSKLFQETVKQYQETLDLWKLTGQTMKAFFAECRGKIDRGTELLFSINEQVVNIQMQKSDTILKCFKIVQILLNQLEETPKSGG